MTTATIRLPALDWKVAMTDPRTGIPTPYFQKFWQLMSVNVQIGDVDISGKVDKGQSSGWTSPTGTGSKSGYTVYVSPTISNPPTQAQVQAISDHLQIISQHVKALVDAGLASGLLE